MNLSAAQRRYIEGMGQAMAGWGLPRTTGRIYAYLLLRADPAEERPHDEGFACALCGR